MLVTRVISEGVAEWLSGVLPVSYAWAVKAQGATEALERPVTVVIAEAGEVLHPKLLRLRLVLRGEFLPKQEEQAGFPEAFGDLCGVLEAGFAELRASLAQRGLLLRVLRGGGQSDEPEGEAARRMEREYALTVQTGV